MFDRKKKPTLETMDAKSSTARSAKKAVSDSANDTQEQGVSSPQQQETAERDGGAHELTAVLLFCTC